MIREYGWTEAEINATDPDLIDVLMIELMARNDHELLSRKPGKDDKDLRAAQAKRKAEIVKWRNEAKKKNGSG